MKLKSEVVKVIISQGRMALLIPAAEGFHKYIKAMVEELEQLDLTAVEVEMDTGWNSIALTCLTPGSAESKDRIFEGVVAGIIPAFMIETFASEMFKKGEVEMAYMLTKVKDSVKDVVFTPEFGLRLTQALIRKETAHETNGNTTIQ